jgi:hypothetical protein
MPMLLGTIPALREKPAGLAVMAVVMAVTLGGLRLIWPRRKT